MSSANGGHFVSASMCNASSMSIIFCVVTFQVDDILLNVIVWFLL